MILVFLICTYILNQSESPHACKNYQKGTCFDAKDCNRYFRQTSTGYLNPNDCICNHTPPGDGPR